MKRKIYSEMLAWKARDAARTALLIDGARRVGKSYIVEAFARQEYRSFIFIDFNKVNRDVQRLFTEHLDDLDTFYAYLTAYFNVRLYPGESVIIFDEVQLFPRARAAIKYLVADGRYHFIETGSLISIKANVADIVIPSEERHLKMNPMDFEEFLWAMGNETLMPLIRDCFSKQKPLGNALHRKAMDAFRQYLLIGGMPQTVKEYAKHHSFADADTVKRDILALYRADIIKYAKGYERKVEAIFDEIPAQLQKHEKRFNLASISKQARYREYEDALFWLEDAMIANICYNSTAPNIGLKLNSDRMTLKCYMADTGLLISHAFDEKALATEAIYQKLLTGSLEFNEGMIMENIVAQMLTAVGHKLYFYSNSSREDAASRMEIDFLIAKPHVTNRHNISPIEVKSGKGYSLTSLQKFRTKFARQLYRPYVLQPGDLMEKEDFLCLPLYMASFL